MIIILIRTRADMYKNITPDYYGYRDDDDGILAVREKEREVRTCSLQFLMYFFAILLPELLMFY